MALNVSIGGLFVASPPISPHETIAAVVRVIQRQYFLFLVMPLMVFPLAFTIPAGHLIGQQFERAREREFTAAANESLVSAASVLAVQKIAFVEEDGVTWIIAVVDI